MSPPDTRTVRIPLRRDVVTTETVPVGSLAVAVHDAQHALIRAEAALERMLDSLYGDKGWSNFEHGESFELDIYDCAPSPAAVEALFRAGFRVVAEHEHPRSKFAKCACVRTRRAS